MDVVEDIRKNGLFNYNPFYLNKKCIIVILQMDFQFFEMHFQKVEINFQKFEIHFQK
jgi:hypothetical protein